MSIELLLAKLDFDSFVEDSVKFVVASSTESTSKEWFAFCERLKRLSSSDLSPSEKLILGKAAISCLKNGAGEAELDQLISAAIRIKLIFGPTIFHLVFTAKIPEGEKRILNYLKLYQAVEELKDEPDIIALLMGFNALFSKGDVSLTALIGEICTKRVLQFKAKHSSRPVDEVVAAFNRVDQHLQYPLNSEEMREAAAELLAIEAEKEKLIGFNSDQLRANIEHHSKLLKTNPKLASSKVQVLATLRELIRRHFKIFPHDTQMMAILGILQKPASLRGRIAQVKTGEGKSTLIAILAAYMAAQGNFVDIVSSNEYLAMRDCVKYKEFFASIGITSSHICHPEPKKEDFNAQILFATGSGIKFSILRDDLHHREHRYSTREGRLVPRSLDVVIADEIDTLVDTAMNSARIAVNSPDDNRWVYEPILTFVREHKGDAFIEADLKLLREKLAGVHKGRYKEKAEAFSNERLGRWMSSAHTALQFNEDTHYIIQDTRTLTSKGYQDIPTVVIVDHMHTGRTSEGSRWSDGLHEFIEVKHGIQPDTESNTAASLSHPSLFVGYKTLFGLTGTMGGNVIRAEVREIYDADSFDVPPHVPNKRVNLGFRVFNKKTEQFQAIYDALLTKTKKTAGFFSFFSAAIEAESCLVLFNTIEDTIAFGKFLTTKKMAHQLLNERQAESEDEVIKRAAYPGVITVATNMAGRGTDILAKKLHVIFADFATNDRVEAQGNGRSARQGKEGSCETVLSVGSPGLLALSPELFLRFKKSNSTDEEFKTFLYELRDKRTLRESGRRKKSLAIEAVCHSKLQAFFDRLKKVHDDFAKAGIEAALVKRCESFSLATEVPADDLDEAYDSVILYARTLLDQKRSSASIDWKSLIKQFKDIFVKELIQKWSKFYTQLSDYHQDNLEEATAKIEADYAKLQKDFEFFNINELFRRVLAETQKPPKDVSMKSKLTGPTLFSSSELNLQKALRQEAACGNDVEVFRLLQLGVFIDAQDDNPEKRKTALHWAVDKGRLSTARLLMAAGASYTLEDRAGTTAKGRALGSTVEGMSALMSEALAGDARNLLLSKYKIVKDTELPSWDEALRQAAASGHDEAVFALIRAGADLNAQDDNPSSKKTALHLAIEKGHLNTARLLVAAKALTDVKDAKNLTASDTAAKSTLAGMKAFIRKAGPLGKMDLLRAKYKLSITDPLEKVLRCAAAAGDVGDVASLLVEDVNIDAKDDAPSSQKTALHLSVQNGHVLAAQLLVSAGATIDMQDASKRKPEAYATTTDMREVFATRSSLELSL